MWLVLLQVGVDEPAADKKHAEPVVVAVAESSRDAVVEFDESVHGFGAAVIRSVGVEVGQECRGPAFEGPAEPCDLGNLACRKTVEDSFGDCASRGRVGMALSCAQLLGL